MCFFQENLFFLGGGGREASPPSPVDRTLEYKITSPVNEDTHAASTRKISFFPCHVQTLLLSDYLSDVIATIKNPVFFFCWLGLLSKIITAMPQLQIAS